MTLPAVALVTGASRGIGAATARELARRGYRIALTARDASRLGEVADSIRASGGEALTLAGDLCDLQFAEAVVQQTLATWSRIDLLVNNAIWREIISMRDISVESWERTLRLGLTVPAFLARWCAESMRNRHSGVIINISSIMSQKAAGISPAYIACKGGIDSLTYELATLYGDDGIRVVTVAPGAIDTELSRDYSDSDGNDVTSQIERHSREMIMLGRWGSPDEIAKVVAFVASSDAAYITGTTITVDGGWTHQHMPKPFRNQLQQGR